jgi:hypothetical protein
MDADKDICELRSLRRNHRAKTIPSFFFNLRLSAFICG